MLEERGGTTGYKLGCSLGSIIGYLCRHGSFVHVRASFTAMAALGQVPADIWGQVKVLEFGHNMPVLAEGEVTDRLGRLDLMRGLGNERGFRTETSL